MTPFIIIERHHRCSSEEHETGFESITAHHKFGKRITNALGSAEGYSKYIKKHGCHFTDELAEHVSRTMENASGQNHSWTAAQVKKALEGLGYSYSTKIATLGDVTYAANMLYADLYPEALKDEVSCLKGASAMACDPDGYDGMIFTRWSADAMAKAINIDWEKFI